VKHAKWLIVVVETWMHDFQQSLAIVIGVDQYDNGIPPLRSAVNDARRLAQLLADGHGYTVQMLLDQDASLAALNQLFTSTLPAQVGTGDRVLIYFAGHGIALDGEDGPAGYLVPQDAHRDNVDSLLPMSLLNQALSALPCRHLLLILDCCFAGAFRWSSTRDLSISPRTLYRERYERFVRDPAWQVLTSAASDEKALDVLERFAERGSNGQHSPFALALFEALAGHADFLTARDDGPPRGDGVITATELYSYLRDQIELNTLDRPQRQTPGLWCLPKHGKGEFVFLAPGQTIDLPPAPALSPANNPYRGLESFDERHNDLFFGRDSLVAVLQLFVAGQPLTVVTGISGSGKSSLVKAGLLPRLREDSDQRWEIIGPLRPGTAPARALANLALPVADSPTLAARVGAWAAANPEAKLLLVIDQFEELVTLCPQAEREQVLKELAEALVTQPDRLSLVLTVRSDFEPQFAGGPLHESWGLGRFVVPLMTQDDLRSAIRGPAAARVLFFEPDSLVERIINEVVQMPGALPLLSFTLSELYLRYLARGAEDRTLTEADYEALGGVTGALRTRASAEYEGLDAAHRATMRRMLLRMVALEGGELARRRVVRAEIDYPDPVENARVETVIQRLAEARLVVAGQEPAGQSYVEPAHDALVQGWDRLWQWVREEQETLVLQRRLTQAALDWMRAGRPHGLLWDDDPRLKQAETARLASGSWLNRLDAEFVAASTRHRVRQLQRTIGAVAAAMVFLATLAIVALLQRNIARDAEQARATQQAIAEAQQATAEAEAHARATEVVVRSTAQAAAVLNEQRAVAEQKTAEARRQEAERQRLVSISEALAAQAPRSQERLKQDELGALLARQAYLFNQRSGNPAESQIDSALRAVLSVPYFSTVLRGHTDRVWSVAFSPDGSTLASGSLDGTVRLWDVRHPGSKPVILSGHRLWVTVVAFSPDGRTLASAGDDQTVRLWNLRQLDAPPVMLHHPGIIWSLAFSPDGQALASGGQDGLIRLWDLRRLDATPTILQGATSAIRSLTFSPDGQTLATGSCDGAVRLWNVSRRDGAAVMLGRHESGCVRSLAFEQSGRILASGGDDQTVRLWSPYSPGASPLVGEAHAAPVRSVAFSPDGQFLASSGDDQTVRLWDPYNLDAQPTILSVHLSAVGAVAFSSDSRTLASGSDDQTIRLWDLSPPRAAPQVLRGHLRGVESIALSPDGHTLASGGLDNLVVLQDVRRPDAQPTILRHPDDWVTSVAFSPDGSTLATATYDGAVRLWNVDRPDAASREWTNPGGVAVAFSPDGHTIASAGNPTVRLRDLRRPDAEPIILNGHENWVGAIAFSPDGGTLASGSLDRTIRIWNLRQPDAAPLVLRGHEDAVTSVAFSPDGGTLASGSSDRTVRIWDLRQPDAAPVVLRGHVDKVRAVAFSPDGRRLASASDDKTVRLWDVGHPAGDPVVLTYAYAIGSLVFSADGEMLIAGASVPTAQVSQAVSSLKPILVTLVNTRTLADLVCDKVWRNLTLDEWRRFVGEDIPYERTCPERPAPEMSAGGPAAQPTPAKGLAAPTPLFPPDGAVLDYAPPRIVTLEWAPVPGAASYTVEVEFCQPAGCASHAPWILLPDLRIPRYTFDFVGAQPGRWRVWAVDTAGHAGPKTAWREFTFAP